MGKPAKVLHFVSIMNQAGQETFIMNVYRHLNKERVQFDFLCTSPEKGDYDDEIHTLGGNIYTLPPNPFEKIKYANYIGNVYRLYKFLRKHREYVFHIHTYHALDGFLSSFSARISGIQNVILHSHNSNAPHPLLHKIFSNLLKIIKIKRFACSNNAGEWMFGSNAMRNNDVKIVNNGIKTQSFTYNPLKREKLRKEFGVQNKIVIGHIGRFNFQKNHDYLIDIFNEIKGINENTVLMLVGRGDLESQIKDKVEQMGLSDSVIFTGVRSDIPNLLQAMDVLLLPSHFEGLPVVLIEAQAAGLKCFASDVVSSEAKISELLHFISLEESPTYWAERILREVNYQRIDTHNEIVLSGFDIKDTAKWLEDFYDEINQ